MDSRGVMEIGYHTGTADRTFRPILRDPVLPRFLHRARDLWTRALREHATPRELALSVALGVFVGCTPLIGAHFWIALGLASVLRLNRIWAIVGSRVSFFLTLPWVVLAEIQVAHRLRTGRWAALLAHDALAHAREYFTDWWLGVLPVGSALALVFGLAAFSLAERRARTLRQRRPSAAPPPSSGCPP